MSNKINIEEDIKILEEMLKNKEEIIKYHSWIGTNSIDAIENILADRERLEKENKQLKIAYKLMENEAMRDGAEEIRILEAKANKYDSLVEKMEDKLIWLKEYKTKLEIQLINSEIGTNISLFEEEISEIENQIKLLQELLDTEKEN